MNIECNPLYNCFIDKKQWIILSISCLFSVLLFFTVFYKNDLTILPSKQPLSITFYNDSIDGGKSKIIAHTSNDTIISMQFVLNDGFVRPYIGTTIENIEHSYFDLSDYNQLEIKLKAGELKNINVYIASKVSDDEIKKDEIFFSNNIELIKTKNSYLLDLHSFKIPDWWYDINNLSSGKNISPDWHRCSKISIATGLLPKLGTKQEIKIKSIIFKTNNTLTIIILVVCNVVLLLGMFAIQFFTSRKASEKNITIHYKPISIKTSSKEKQSHFDYINQNFHESTLSLEIVSKKTGLNQRNISDDIYEKFHCNFKTYVNQIRITEAQRLLKETDLHISEIAYNVGFSSPNNFNRVFKKHTGLSPTEFLQNSDN